MPLRSHSLLLFPPQPRRLPGYIRRTAEPAQESGPEGLALHAATSPFTGIRQCAPKAKELTVERHYTGESGSRILPVKSPAACQ